MKFDRYSSSMLTEYITSARAELDGRLVIPAHHYITAEIVDIADFTGDSYKLAVDVSRTDAEFIVFCGVKFMADGAAILAKENQHVLIPEPLAGCPMADMITADYAEASLEIIKKVSNRGTAPVVYMNSHADSKSFCGRNGGSVCSSSNAKIIVKYYLDKDMNVFFFPDYHLGSNVAQELGIDPNQVARIYSDYTFESDRDLSDVKIFLWNGFCPVHYSFDIEDVERMRRIYPEGKIIVHPESKKSVADLSDMQGSTQYIYDTIRRSEPGSVWIVGTELTFVQRIARDFTDKTVEWLKPSPCPNMRKITLKNTALAVSSVIDYVNGNGILRNEVHVEQEHIDGARIALQRMIEIVEKG
ncbi:MAG TPA: quinolinate synthase [Spirochaetota bacterium]|nr:quinolinate synthase [Spirochaetota bacterium]